MAKPWAAPFPAPPPAQAPAASPSPCASTRSLCPVLALAALRLFPFLAGAVSCALRLHCWQHQEQGLSPCGVLGSTGSRVSAQLLLVPDGC